MTEKFHPALSISNIKNLIPVTLDMEKAQYNSWAHLFKLHYKAYDVLDHIITVSPEFSSSSDSTTTTVTKDALWYRLDALVLQWIYGTISNDLMNQILEDESDAANAWLRLQNIFQDKKNSRALYLQRQFNTEMFLRVTTNTIRLDDFPNCAAYCQEIKILADQLRNVGDNVNDDRMVLQLKAGLNDNFDTVGTYFTQLDKLPSFYEARSKLILEEIRKKKQASNNSSSFDTALLANSSSKSSAPTESVPFNDQIIGHQNHQSNFRSSNYRGRSGRGAHHQSRGGSSYPNRGRNSNRGRGMGFSPNHSGTQWQPTDINAALHTVTLNPPDDTWYLDTGATSHMTANSDFDPFGFTVKDFPQGTPVLRCNSKSDLYPITNSVLQHLSKPSAFTALSTDIWHHRLGHPGDEVLRSLSNKKFITSTVSNRTQATRSPPHTDSTPICHPTLTQSRPILDFTAQHNPPSQSPPPADPTTSPTSPIISSSTPTNLNSPTSTSSLDQSSSIGPQPVSSTSQSQPVSATSNSDSEANSHNSNQPSNANQPPRTIITHSMTGIHKPKVPFNLSSTTSTISPLPHSPKEALSDPNWNMTMVDEYKTLMDNNTWILVPRTSNMHVIRSIWIFRHKIKFDGTLERYKARLVGDGQSQTIGIDCNETFSPVVKPATIRLVLSIALSKSWHINQLDVKNAFLHGSLNETVYMHQSFGFRDSTKPDHVCLLKRSLYGLKQAPRAWYQRFASFASTIGFIHSPSDHSLFVYNHGNDTAYLLLYVDDIILVTSSIQLRTTLLSLFASEFAMKDLGSLSYFLGISVTRTHDGLFLSQEKYAESIANRAGMATSNTVKTPVDNNGKLSGNTGPSYSNPTEFRSLAGALQYLTFTRPDISYAVQQICLHMHDPKVCHMQALCRIIRYVRGTISHGLHLTRSPLSSPVSYTDVD
ncbi:uncharacterized protein [Rutidosis leptorrhynchoides]|uniref:uncharacterized protein n=1 Tax=Rutidosis leptorrhynchoides TaxID=125765 RepID=UPI003A99BFE6